MECGGAARAAPEPRRPGFPQRTLPPSLSSQLGRTPAPGPDTQDRKGRASPKRAPRRPVQPVKPHAPRAPPWVQTRVLPPGPAALDRGNHRAGCRGLRVESLHSREKAPPPPSWQVSGAPELRGSPPSTRPQGHGEARKPFQGRTKLTGKQGDAGGGGSRQMTSPRGEGRGLEPFVGGWAPQEGVGTRLPAEAESHSPRFPSPRSASPRLRPRRGSAQPGWVGRGLAKGVERKTWLPRASPPDQP